MKTDLTASRLRELFTFDNGVFKRVLPPTGRKPASGTPGSIDRYGYLRLYVDGARYSAHRLAWLYVHGAWPTDQIDHMNGVKTDNRIENLRVVSNAVNQQNIRKANRRSQLGVLGVHRHKRKFKAVLDIDGSPTYLGLYATAEEAYQAYVEAKRIHHPGCTI